LKNLIFIVLSSLLFLSSCDYFQLKNNTNSTNEIIARVDNQYLYQSDLDLLFETGVSREDSLLVTTNFIESWARKQIMLQKAALNLPEDQEDVFAKLIEDYKNDLYINYYKERVIAQRFDTLVNHDMMVSFYQKNQNAFRLNDELVQYKQISYVTQALNDKKIKRLFVKKDKESIETLQEDELKFLTMQLNDSTWVSYSDLVKKSPIIKTKEKQKLLRANSFFQLKDSTNTHMIYITKVLNRNEIAPLEFVYPVVKQMILHKNKLQFIKNIETKLIEDAIQNNIYEKY